MTIRVIIAYLLNLFDLFMTSHWVGKYGIDIEANPVGRWLYTNHLAVPVKVFGVGILFLILHYAVKCMDEGTEHSFQWWDIASWLVMAVYATLAIYHLFILSSIVR